MKNNDYKKSYGASLLHILGATQRHIEKIIAERISNTPFRISQVPTILLLEEKPGLSQKDICDYLSLEQPTIASTLKKLEREGSIFRETDKNDRRITRYYLSESSLRFAPKVREIIATIENKIVEHLDTLDLEQLKKDIVKVEANVDPIWNYAKRWEADFYEGKSDDVSNWQASNMNEKELEASYISIN